MHAPERHATGVAALVVGLFAVAGAAIRVAAAQDSILADELSTWWIISTHGLSGVVSTVHSNAEITPPLYFIAAWLATQVDLTPELARAPSLVAGVATVPVVYLIGLRTIGRWPAVVAAAVTSLSPFMVYYSAEARSYGLLMLFVSLSTLFLLLAVDGRRTISWVLYAACSSAAMYTHYTAAFALAAQLGWVLWAHPEARRAALAANFAAALTFLPWLSGLRADLDSPTTKILSALSPFDLEHIRIALTHTAIGYPYTALGLRQLPGIAPAVLFTLAVVTGLGTVAVRASRRGWRAWLRAADRRLVLVVGLAVSAPVLEAVVSAVGTNLFSTRNLAPSWPGFALALAAVLWAPRPPLRYVTVTLALACFAVGGVRLTQAPYERPKYQEIANFIDRNAAPGDVVVDAAVLSPGPYGALDVAFKDPHRVIRFQAPTQRSRPFGVFDHVIPRGEVIPKAVSAARGGRLFVVSVIDKDSPRADEFPSRYRLAESRVYPGTVDLRLQVWTTG